MSSIKFASLHATVDPKAADDAWMFLVDFTEETLARDGSLEIAVEGRFDPSDQADDFASRTVVLSAGTFDRYNNAVATLLKALRERTGSSAAFTPYDAMSLEGFTVSEAKTAIRALTNRWAEVAPVPKRGGGGGILLLAAVVGVGYLWWNR